jgi:cell division GTPase FtsZ
MFVNATDMKNRFFEHPNESNIKEIGEHFCLHDSVIAIDNSDVMELMDGAENAIVLSGKATGSNRCGDAIEEAVLHICNIAGDYDLFSANKVIILIICPKDNSMLMSENETINTFVQMFHQKVSCKWGLAEKDNIHDMRIMIIASNLKKK